MDLAKRQRQPMRDRVLNSRTSRLVSLGMVTNARRVMDSPETARLLSEWGNVALTRVASNRLKVNHVEVAC